MNFLLSPSTSCSSFSGANSGVYSINLSSYISIFQSHWENKLTSICSQCTLFSCGHNPSKDFATFCKLCKTYCAHTSSNSFSPPSHSSLPTVCTAVPYSDYYSGPTCKSGKIVMGIFEDSDCTTPVERSTSR